MNVMKYSPDNWDRVKGLSRPRPTHSTTNRERFPSALHQQRIPGSTFSRQITRPVSSGKASRVLPLTLNSCCLSEIGCPISGAGTRLDIPWASALYNVFTSDMVLAVNLAVYASFLAPMPSLPKIKPVTYTFLCKSVQYFRRTLKGICRDFRLGLICRFEVILNYFIDLYSDNYL